MAKEGVWGIDVNYSCKLGADSVNLLPDPGEKGSERQMANFGTNRRLARVTKTKKANDRTNWAGLGENGPLGVPAGPIWPIIAIELPNGLLGAHKGLGEPGGGRFSLSEFQEHNYYLGVGGKEVILCYVVQDLEPDLGKHVRNGCFWSESGYEK